MMRSLYSGVSGLKTHQTKMDVIGNNISNVNTVAFKSSSTTFQDVMYQTTSQASAATGTVGGKNAKQIGLGVTNGATKVSITSAGAAQSTGDALDIRLSDTNTTHFFVVNNGSENVYTRAGSFYVDADGNMAMTTTGYLVYGYVADNNGSLSQDLGALRVMSAANKTSAPEATTAATFSGIIDQNDSDFESSNGYIRSLTFYDNKGYTYTAKFAFKVVDAKEGKYTMELTSVTDSSGNDILETYLSQADTSLSDIFGNATTTSKSYSFNTNNVAFADDGSIVYTPSNQTTTPAVSYTLELADGDSGEAGSKKLLLKDSTGATVYSLGDTTDTTAEAAGITLSDIFNTNGDDIVSFTGTDDTDLTKLTTSGITATINTSNYDVQFNTKTGAIISVGGVDYTNGYPDNAIVFNANLLGPNYDTAASENAAISAISLDFSDLLNYDNSGTSTVTTARGIVENSVTVGAGKKMGTMTGLSVSENGDIYGTYDNGNTKLLGRIAVASFANASGLEELGNNCYGATLNSGDAEIGVISADGSSMSTGQLEMSNVDLSSEFTDMITTQRGFQANSRIITVSDTLLEELINLKRS